MLTEVWDPDADGDAEADEDAEVDDDVEVGDDGGGPTTLIILISSLAETGQLFEVLLLRRLALIVARVTVLSADPVEVVALETWWRFRALSSKLSRDIFGLNSRSISLLRAALLLDILARVLQQKRHFGRV